MSTIGSSWYSFLVEPSNVMSYSSNPDSHYIYGKLDTNEWERIFDLANRFNLLAENPLKETIRDALLLYGLSLDSSEPNTTFQLLWSVAELFLGERGKIENGLKALHERESLEYRFIVDILYRKRNDLAHRGKLSAQIDDLNHLKHIVDALLLFAIDMCDQAGSPEVLSQSLGYVYDVKEKSIVEGALASANFALSHFTASGWPAPGRL